MLLNSRMEKQSLCKKILNDLNKSDVRVKVSQDIKGNYYSYINNCIYLNNKNSETIKYRAKENVVIAHECIHATQNKALHITNVILANLELLLFLVLFIIYFAFNSLVPFRLIYIIIWMLALICRLVLELPAIISSFDLAVKYSDERVSEIIQKDKKKINFLLPLGILSFTWLKLLRLFLIIFL